MGGRGKKEKLKCSKSNFSSHNYWICNTEFLINDLNLTLFVCLFVLGKWKLSLHDLGPHLIAVVSVHHKNIGISCV